MLKPEQPKQWMHKPKSLKKSCVPARKLMATVFWERKGEPMVEFMQQRITVLLEVIACEKTKLQCVGSF
jgi:hypothetical protein